LASYVPTKQQLLAFVFEDCYKIKKKRRKNKKSDLTWPPYLKISLALAQCKKKLSICPKTFSSFFFDAIFFISKSKKYVILKKVRYYEKKDK